ncbi:uncharacterized protein LOC133202040 [Saccostrea echinata]|uniref:uncharacterized protein LOC133202040 n=1 Tax=Saccostrea echinata TaxID=191078 RepID=UPI002A840498|nr:uncharacterized protein LOC133202040 [Saccostrea echinata]
MAWPGVLRVAFALTLISLFFVLVGYLLPWWFVGKGFYMGVFYGIICIPGDITDGNCTVFSYYDIKAENSSLEQIVQSVLFVIIQVVTSVAVGFTLLASLILIIGACGNVKSKGPYVLAAIFQFFGALVAGLTAGLFAAVYVATFVGLEGHLALDGKNFPYAILSLGIGGFILFIAFICLAIATCTWRNMDDDDDDDLNPPYPMSDYKGGYGNQGYTSDSRRNDYIVPSSSHKYGYESRNDNSNSRYDYSSSRNDYTKYTGSRNDYSGSRNGYPAKQDNPYRNDNMYRPYNSSSSRY